MELLRVVVYTCPRVVRKRRRDFYDDASHSALRRTLEFISALISSRPGGPNIFSKNKSQTHYSCPRGRQTSSSSNLQTVGAMKAQFRLEQAKDGKTVHLESINPCGGRAGLNVSKTRSPASSSLDGVLTVTGRESKEILSITFKYPTDLSTPANRLIPRLFATGSLHKTKYYTKG